MADVITRLRVESSEYDNKIKRAQQGLLNLEQEVRKTGTTFSTLSREQVNYIQSLGRMETSSRNAKGKIGELGTAFTELSLMYKRMTDQEKASPAGKAMSQSLDQLKTRVQDAKKELADIDKELKNTSSDGGNLSSVLDSVAGKFGLNTSMIKSFSGTLGAAVVAVKVAKDAFFNSEEGIDEWGRTVEASQTIYEAFLYSLNNGDVNGFLSKIGQIQQAAVEAYNALDLLGTQKSIQAPQLSGKQAEISRMETMLRTGRFIEAADGRKSSMKTGDVLSQSQKDRIAKQLESAMGEVATITTSQVKTATTAIDKLYAEQATTLGISKKEFMEATKNWDSFTDALAKSDQYWKWRNEHTTYSSPTTNASPNATSIATATMQREIYDDSKNPYRGYGWVKSFKDDGEMWKRLTEEIAKRDAAQSQLYGQYGRMYRQVNRVEGVKPYGGGGGGGTRSGGGTPWAPIAMTDFTGIDITGRSVNDVTKDIQREQAKFNAAGDEMGRAMAKSMIEALQQERATMMNEGDVTKGGFADAYNYNFGKDIARLEKDKIRNDNENKATTEKTMVGELQKITGGVQGMLSGLNQLGVDIPEGLNNVVSGLSGMLSVLQSINMIVGTIQGLQTVGTFLGIFGHGGIVGKAANGMVVPGNSFSGDNLRMPVVGGGMIGVNSGELILSMSQQNNVASALLSRQKGGAVDVQPWIDGERMFLGLNNTTRRQGKGEIVTTSMLKQKGIL